MNALKLENNVFVARTVKSNGLQPITDFLDTTQKQIKLFLKRGLQYIIKIKTTDMASRSHR